jgi:O-antigen/teichoic acid export membrane protein
MIEKIIILYERVSKHLNELVWVLFGQALAFVGSFLGIKVLTNIMVPEEYGKLALGLTISGFLNLYVYAPLGGVATRYLVICRERRELNIYFALLKRAHHMLAVGIPLLALVAGGIAWWRAGSQWALIVVIASLYGVVSGINTSYQALQTVVRQRKIVALHQGGDVWVRTGITILLLFLFEKSGYTALIGYLLGTFCITFSQGYFALKHPEINQFWRSPLPGGSRQRETAREFFAYAVPFMVFAGFSVVSTYADRWVIQGLFGAQEVGIYAAVYQIANAPVSIFFAMQNQFMVPIVYERAGAMTSATQAVSSFQALRMMVVFSTVVVLLMVGFTSLFSEPLMRLLTSRAFSAYHHMLWVTTLGLGIYNVAQVFSMKGLYYNTPQIYFWPKAAQAISFLLSAFVLAKSFGIIGIPMALCASSLVYGVVILLVNRRIKYTFSS